MSSIHNREGEWVFDLYLHGQFHRSASLTCGTKTALDAVKQWQRTGFTVVITKRPSKKG